MTDEQKERARQSLAKARAAKQAKQAELETKEIADHGTTEAAQPQQTEQPTATQLSEDVKDQMLLRLMREMDELKSQINSNATPDQKLQYTAQQEGVHIGQKGVQGKLFRYPVEQSYYPDPTDRLYDEPSLARFGLRMNYHFTWKVEGVEYEKYGITYAEPKFTIRIFRKMFADDGTPSGQAALINTNIIHEDEVAARRAAERLGLGEEFSDFRDMMNEVRYYRIRQWLVDLFAPPKVDTHKAKPLTTVVDGKVVEMYDTETLIDGTDGISKAQSVSGSVRI
jgi:hypothetical protein